MKSLIAALIALCLALPLFAADEAKPGAPAAVKETSVVGVVAVVKDQAGVVTAVSIKAEKEEYAVGGAKKADVAALVGKKVKATGVVTKEHHKVAIAVSAVEEVKEVVPAPAPAPVK